MQEKYEQALKETYRYLMDCIANQPAPDTVEYLYHLGIDKCYVIERQMAQRGFTVHATKRDGDIYIYPMQYNLPTHIWRE